MTTQMHYVFSYPSSLGHYTAENFVLRCFDDRFWKVFKNFLKSLGITHIDPESVAGGAKVLASPEKESDRDFLLRELEKSIMLHHTKKVLLFTHHDCGAYGGFTRFKNDWEAEFQFHTEEHQKAAKLLKKQFPDLAVETYFLDKNGVVRTNE
ncbi:MAG: hypothetical protein G01um101466_837 [Parcubacteria group bacterium Gr01-1014_66]|nr:MAG: hypothetical protein G01um101466_837 [Parcubacteria group bacterium Gr01-1014_66]